MVRSAMRTAEQSWALRISGRLTPGATARLLNLIATDNDANDASDSSKGAAEWLASQTRPAPSTSGK